MHRVLLSAANRREVCALIAAGCTLRQAARYLGCSVQRIAHTAQSNRGFARALRQAEMRFEVKCLRAIESQMGKSWRAASWLLERRYPRRYGRGRKSAQTELRPLLTLLDTQWRRDSAGNEGNPTQDRVAQQTGPVGKPETPSQPTGDQVE